MLTFLFAFVKFCTRRRQSISSRSVHIVDEYKLSCILTDSKFNHDQVTTRIMFSFIVKWTTTTWQISFIATVSSTYLWFFSTTNSYRKFKQSYNDNLFIGSCWYVRIHVLFLLDSHDRYFMVTDSRANLSPLRCFYDRLDKLFSVKNLL